jgi:molecular chaperone DnaK
MPIIGIDLGMSNSAAAVQRSGRPIIIPSAEGITPAARHFSSCVALTADGQMERVSERQRRSGTP